MPRENPYNASKLGTPANIDMGPLSQLGQWISLDQPKSPSAISLIEGQPAFVSLAVGQRSAVMLNSSSKIGKNVQLLGFANEATSLTSSANTFHDQWALVHLWQPTQGKSLRLTVKLTLLHLDGSDGWDIISAMIRRLPGLCYITG